MPYAKMESRLVCGSCETRKGRLPIKALEVYSVGEDPRGEATAALENACEREEAR